jgi:hypothetical protein
MTTASIPTFARRIAATYVTWQTKLLTYFAIFLIGTSAAVVLDIRYGFAAPTAMLYTLGLVVALAVAIPIVAIGTLSLYRNIGSHDAFRKMLSRPLASFDALVIRWVNRTTDGELQAAHGHEFSVLASELRDEFSQHQAAIHALNSELEQLTLQTREYAQLWEGMRLRRIDLEKTELERAYKDAVDLMRDRTVATEVRSEGRRMTDRIQDFQIRVGQAPFPNDLKVVLRSILAALANAYSITTEERGPGLLVPGSMSAGYGRLKVSSEYQHGMEHITRAVLDYIGVLLGEPGPRGQNPFSDERKGDIPFRIRGDVRRYSEQDD